MSGSVLVTGADGFVGRVLCDHLSRAGFRVSGTTRNPNRKESASAVERWIEIKDLGLEKRWAQIVEGFDYVVHLAARVHVMHENSNDPMREFQRANTEGTCQLAEAVMRSSVKRLVFVSTIKVYGEKTHDEAWSLNSAAAPSDPYAVSKYAAEQAITEVFRDTPDRYSILRPPLIFGPNVGGNLLRLLKLIRRGLPLPFAAIANRRSMLGVRNFADAITFCMTESRAGGRAVPVAELTDLSTPELVTAMADAMGVRTRLVPVPATVIKVLGRLAGRAAEVDRLIGSLVVDQLATTRAIGWSPPFDVHEQIREMVESFLGSKTT